MGLRLKFNLVLLLVFVVGLCGTAYVSHTLLHRNAREEVFRNAGLMLETAMAIRKYTVDQVRPNLEAHAEGVFVPQSVPAYAATETVAELRKKYPDYSYKEATLNPINPRNRVTDWEADLVQEFRNNLLATELYGERDTATGRSLFIARPIQVKTEACLSCHSTPAAAPASMVKQYGGINGYGWKLDEIVGAQVVSVPMSLPIRNADRAFQAFMISLITIFVIVFLFLNVMLSWLIIRPVSTMSHMAEQISTGNFKIPEFDERGKDEIAVLGNSFNRMRRSLQKAMKMIEG